MKISGLLLIIIALFIVSTGQVFGQDFFEDKELTYPVVSTKLNQIQGQTVGQNKGMSVAGLANDSIMGESATHKLVFVIEKITEAKYLDVQELIGASVTELNQRFQISGISRTFVIEKFIQSYDKSVNTSCKAANTAGKNLPAEFCNHSNDYIYIAVDETGGSNYSWTDKPSVEWHGYNGLFGYQGNSVFIHEVCHALGLPDLYFSKIDSATNLVNGLSYDPFAGKLMHNLTPGDLTEWDKEIVNRENKTFLTRRNSWIEYQPSTNTFKLIDNYGCLGKNIDISIYEASPDWSKQTSPLPAAPKYDGKTDVNGEFQVTGKILGSDAGKALKIFLIKVNAVGVTEYKWLDFRDINFAYWQGNTSNAVFEIRTNINFCIPTEAITQVPPIPTVTKIAGDYDGDGKVEKDDFEIWKAEYLAGRSTKDKFEIWKVGYLTAQI